MYGIDLCLTLIRFFPFAGNFPKPHVSLNPGPEVNFGDRVDITCSVLTDHLGGMYVLQKTPGPFRMQRYSASETVTFTIPKTNLSHGGLYHCHYQKKIQSKTIDLLGDAVELKVTGQRHCFKHCCCFHDMPLQQGVNQSSVSSHKFCLVSPSQ